MIIKFKNYNKKISEDKIFTFSNFEPIKYNGNKLASQIRDWLLLYKHNTIKHDNNNVHVFDDKVVTTLEDFFNESGVDRNIFMTYYNEKDKSRSINSFDIDIVDNKITFTDIKINIEEKKKISMEKNRK